MSRSARRALLFALAAYAALLVAILLNPSPVVGSELISRVTSLGQRFHVPAPFVARGRIDFGLNVLAFMPLTLLASLLRPRVSVSTWTAAAFGASLFVEAVQAAQPSRSAAHSDVVANTLGAAIGALAAWAILRRTRQKQARQ